VPTPGIEAAVATVAPRLHVEQVEVPGPATSVDVRAAGWAEASVLAAAAGALVGSTEPRRGTEHPPGVLAVERDEGRAVVTLRSPEGAEASAEVVLGGPGESSRVAVRVACGPVLDEVVLRSYCIGAAHMALGWVTSEGLAVDDAGEIHDLTIRSFGVLRAVDMPPVTVSVDDGGEGHEVGLDAPVNGSDAVFAAVAAAAWLAQGTPPAWPTGARMR
jgi:hypothetical protein